MTIVPGSVDHLSLIISHVVGPAFLLGAVASFISIQTLRLNGIIERLRDLNGLPEAGHAKSRLRADIPRLKRRAGLLNRSLLFAICSGVSAAFLIIVAFAAAMLQLNHVWGTAILFILSLSLLCASLVLFGLEARIGLTEYDHH